MERECATGGLAPDHAGLGRPAPRRDLARAAADSTARGHCLVPAVLSGTPLARVREALYR